MKVFKLKRFSLKENTKSNFKTFLYVLLRAFGIG